jgi:hypothetical protein
LGVSCDVGVSQAKFSHQTLAKKINKMMMNVDGNGLKMIPWLHLEANLPNNVT